MTIFISILVALLLLLSIWIVRNRAADHSEYDSPVSPLMKDAADVSAEHQSVLDKLNQFHQQTSNDIKTQREQMEKFFTGNIDATIIPTDVNGIPAEWVLAEGADPDRRLLYLHGGGFRLGSPKSHRYLTSELSRLAGVSVLALDYRMQPEYKTLDCHLDARSAYEWILANGPESESPVRDLFIAGDSAGELGHMAVKFASAYGCDVTAFTSRESKFDEARGFGAHHVVASRDSAAILELENSLDLLIVTVNVPLDWDALLKTLAPNGRMHVVGAVLEPIPVPVFTLLTRQASVSGSPTGSPVTMAEMLDFAARHNIAPQTEHFPMRQINEAFQHVSEGKARYRVVLDADI